MSEKDITYCIPQLQRVSRSNESVLDVEGGGFHGNLPRRSWPMLTRMCRYWVWWWSRSGGSRKNCPVSARVSGSPRRASRPWLASPVEVVPRNIKQTPINGIFHFRLQINSNNMSSMYLYGCTALEYIVHDYNPRNMHTQLNMGTFVHDFATHL